MRIPLTTISASGVALSTLSGLALAQAVTPAPAAQPVLPTTPAPAAVYDPQQFLAIRGELERLTLTGRGDVDGIILKDGTEVKTPPAVSTQIASALKPGDRVTVHGLQAAALPLVRAVSITDEVTRQTLTDSGVAPNPPPLRPAPPSRGEPLPALGHSTETLGRVRMALHGPQGEVNGVLLESGTILRFPPDQGAQLASFVQPHDSLVAEGITVTNSLGTVVEVQQLGPSRDRLVAVGRPPNPSRRPRPDGGPQGAYPPPPPGPALSPGASPPPAS